MQNEIRDQRQCEIDARRLSSIKNNAYFSFVSTETLKPFQDQRANSCSPSLPRTVPKSWKSTMPQPTTNYTHTPLTIVGKPTIQVAARIRSCRLDRYVFAKRQRSPQHTTGNRAKRNCGSEIKITTTNNKNRFALLAENASEEANKTTDRISKNQSLHQYPRDYYER